MVHTKCQNGEERKTLLPTRLDCIPILHVRGSHYTVGLSIGKMFKSMIRDMLDSWTYFNDVLWKAYLDKEGQLLYDRTLQHCEAKYPHYVEEIRGMADGCGLEFRQLFLLNIDSIITEDQPSHGRSETGCTSIMCNKNEVILGHTEDAMTEILNNVYIVSAEIIDEKDEVLEKFTTFAYAGHLLGYTMGYNETGLVYSVNTLFPSTVHTNGTPRAFIARAICASPNLESVLDTLKDVGAGISDGMSVNVYFAKGDENNNANSRKFYNIEVLPPTGNGTESRLDVLSVGEGQSTVHCNKYLRFKASEQLSPVALSTGRMRTIESYPEPKGLSDVKALLSDQSNEHFPVYICDQSKCKINHVKTVAVGVFDILEKTWSIYLGKPAESRPVAVLPLNF